MNTYKEITKDNGCTRTCYASDNSAEYILTSARAHDMLDAYKDKYGRWPSARWYHKHFEFTREK